MAIRSSLRKQPKEFDIEIVIRKIVKRKRTLMYIAIYYTLFK